MLIMAHFLLSKNNQNSDLKSVKQNIHQIKYTLTVPFMRLIPISYGYFDVIEKMGNQNVLSLFVRETTHCYYFPCVSRIPEWYLEQVPQN